MVENLISDSVFGFETASFIGWDDLVQVDLLGDSAYPLSSCRGTSPCGSMAYDNIVVAAVPEPGTGLLAGIGLAVLALRGRGTRHYAP